MAALRHNLSRRALLGAGAAFGVLPGAAHATAHGADEAAAEEGAAAAARSARTLCAYRRAEARVAAFKAEEALLPPERREWPAVRVLEDCFGDLVSLRLAARSLS